jgi:type IV pilus assembly protein PilE
MVTHIKGFTLFELMVVVAIIGILAALSYPSYQSSIIRSQRADMRAALQQITQSLERYRNQMLTYAPLPPDTDSNFLSKKYIFGSNTYPVLSGDRRVSDQIQYDLSIQTINNGAGYLLSATPRIGSRQAGDGVLVIDHLGKTCWAGKVVNGLKDTACTSTNDTGTGWDDK